MISGTTSHPKFARFKRLLDLPSYSAIGILEGIWMLAAEHAEDGDLSRFSAQDIGDYLEYADDPQRLVEILVESRWLDSDGAGALCIHDWFDHAPSYLIDRLRKRKERRAKANELAEYSKPSKNVQECPGHSKAMPDSPGKSVPTPPNPTQPIPTQPHTTKPDAVGQSVSRSLDGFCFEWDADAIKLTGEKFRKIASLSQHRLPTNALALLAGFGLTVKQGFLGDLAERFKSGDIKNAERYVKGAIRRWCDEHSIDRDTIVERVQERLGEIYGKGHAA